MSRVISLQARRAAQRDAGADEVAAQCPVAPQPALEAFYASVLPVVDPDAEAPEGDA
ncbi:hypothetical protein [Variovorax sp. GT1P44]|uniref:hypothetical protein n=1 Tax=Variovorax sp. GT1P44 TaxID=3443742 RepID=UPI003F48EFB9